MSLSPAVQERIESLIRADRVVLFMKGDRTRPQCGFSAQVVQILDSIVPDYATVDVLADPQIRDGIKQFSSWPTIPQLYVGGEFIGGCDIVKELFASGEIYGALGVDAPSDAPPEIHVSDTAAAELRKLAENAKGRELHLSVDARNEPGLYFGPTEEGEIRVVANGITLVLDRLSAMRANGARIDAQVGPSGPAFRIDLAGTPTVRQLTAKEVKAMLDAGEPFVFVDVRTPEERERAQIAGTRLMDHALHAELEKLDRNTPIVFHCHHGGRSQHAAEHFIGHGFKNVANLVGGIDAWSQEIDPSVPRY
jgi:monothiol glutaredoxin